ncbi:hypothetical protein O6H91_03G085400 [Diphasiastrum complanatum]|uniref:Uncharacterized protein n=1 Tax=Diphasiastrum complanatum TaxID=34168 RepID=A0ACC2E8T6_DIPCM|nr:hypothetical protein O6H91_03G085400 [Diphasiastrum complanatum]
MADAILSVPESSPPKPVQEDNEIPSHILASIPKVTHGNENQENLAKDFSRISVLSNSREELLNTVQKLKKDLQDWRGQLDSQVKTYRQELGELRNTLNTGVEHLKNEFQDLRNALKKNIDAPSDVACKGREGVRTTTAETETSRETEI